VKYSPWFEPLWRRVLVLGFCALWVLFELWYQPQGVWLWVALALLAYGAVEFFFSGRYGKGGPPATGGTTG
jgi:hypothetical protein